METKNDGRNDFDFFIGNWTVKHRRLKTLLSHSNEWDEFESTVTDRGIMGGIANLEEMVNKRKDDAIFGK